VRTLADCYLYGILDVAYVERARLQPVAHAMIAGGVDLIQLRGKDETVDELTDLAGQLYPITAAASVPLVVNDHPVIACRVPVEGVHVGQDDDSISSVRKIVNRPVWIGKSTHSLDQAIAAQHEGADYIGFGPIYATPTKPDYAPVGLTNVEPVHRQVMLPVFCIGGIKRENLPYVLSAGARRVVLVSGFLQARDITDYARACKNLLTSSHPI